MGYRRHELLNAFFCCEKNERAEESAPLQIESPVYNMVRFLFLVAPIPFVMQHYTKFLNIIHIWSEHKIDILTATKINPTIL